MSYLSQLKAKIAEIGPPGELPKLPEPGFVSFDSAPNSPIPEVPLALPQPSSGVARLWLERIRALNTDIAPASVALSRWTQLLADAQRLLVMWGDQAVGLGWGEVDLFAVPPGPERWGRGGLAMALSGRPVIAMTAEARRSRTRTGRSRAIIVETSPERCCCGRRGRSMNERAVNGSLAFEAHNRG